MQTSLRDLSLKPSRKRPSVRSAVPRVVAAIDRESGKRDHQGRARSGRYCDDMRVLLVTNLYPTQEDPTRGIFTQRHVESLRRIGAIEVIPLVVGKTGAGDLSSSRAAVRDALRSERPDIVHVYYGLSGAALPLDVSPPIVLTLCGSDLLWWLHSRRPRPLLERVVSLATAWRAVRVIVQSPVMKRALWLDTLRQRAAVIPTGIDLERFRPLTRRECRRRLGWSETGKVILFPASPERWVKRYNLALEATQAAESLLGYPVELRGLGGIAPEDVPLHLNAADCVLITSLWEAGPIVFTEALACGIPVVTVPVGYTLPRPPSTPYVRVAAANKNALARILSQVLTESLAHERPDRVILPTEDAYASQVCALYQDVVRNRGL